MLEAIGMAQYEYESIGSNNNKKQTNFVLLNCDLI